LFVPSEEEEEEERERERGDVVLIGRSWRVGLVVPRLEEDDGDDGRWRMFFF
jgi:hypothetical protein